MAEDVAWRYSGCSSIHERCIKFNLQHFKINKKEESLNLKVETRYIYRLENNIVKMSIISKRSIGFNTSSF